MGNSADKIDASADAQAAATTPQDDGPTLAWSVHPMKRKPLVSAAVTLFVILIALVVYGWMQSLWFMMLALLIMLGSLAKFYFPTNYKLSGRGVTVKTTTQKLFKEWGIYRSCYPDKKGILLSPFAEPSRLENFRGLYVMFEGNSEPVTAFCREQIARANQKSTAKTDTQTSGGDAAR
ncbi:MAG: hypothetical protein NTW07_08845 [candidate division Zixibacteria bacterium]|nr:hypothetical protein [candidate division Zixibacteria bacterium]